MKAKNIVLTVVFALLLAGPAMLYVVQEYAGVELPSWLTSRGADYLQGSIFTPAAETSVSDKLTIEAFTSKTLQQAVEKKVDTHIPMKAGAMLTNAALQRWGIQTSNVFFGWECYPTFFGGDVNYLPAVDALAYAVDKQSAVYDAGLVSFAQGLTAVAQAYPDVQFIVYFAGGYDTPAVNATDTLVSDAETYSDKVDVMRASLGDESNITLLTSEYTDLQEYYDDFFRTDNHYNMRGGIKIYNQIAQAAGLDAYEMEGDFVDVDGFEFYGALSRWSLDEISEGVLDVDKDYSYLTVTGYDGTVAPLTHDALWGVDADIMPYAFYARYFDNANGVITGGHGDQSVYLVSSSYGGGILRIMADNCRVLERTSDLHSGLTNSSVLIPRLEAGDLDTVVFLATPDDYQTFTTRNPGYFAL